MKRIRKRAGLRGAAVLKGAAVAFGLFGLSFGCSDAGENPDGDGDGDGNLAACEGLDEVACTERNTGDYEETDACWPLFGKNLCGESPELSEFVVCLEGGDGDGTQVTTARDPESGDLYEFSTTTIPPGWSEESDGMCDAGGAGGGD